DAELPAGGGAGDLERLMDAERGAHRTLGIVRMGHGRPEYRHGAVADMLVDGAAMALDLAIHRLEEVAEQLVDVLGVELGGELGEAGEVGKQNSDLAELALGHRLRGRGQRGWRRFAHERLAASAAEAGRRVIPKTAIWAGPRQRRSTVRAEAA